MFYKGLNQVCVTKIKLGFKHFNKVTIVLLYIKTSIVIMPFKIQKQYFVLALVTDITYL